MHLTWGNIEKQLVTLYILFGIMLQFIIPINLFIAELFFLIFIFLLYVFFKERFLITKSVRLWGISFVLTFISAFYSVDIVESLKYCLLLLFFILISNYIDKVSNHNDYFIHVLWMACGFHYLVSWFQYIFPTQFYWLFAKIASGEWMEINYQFYRAGRICGITDQTGTNGFFLSIFALLSFELLNERKTVAKKVFFSFIVITDIIMLSYTGKRLFFIAVLLAMFFSWWIRYRIDTGRRKIQKLVCLIIIVSVGCAFLSKIGVFGTVLSKFVMQWRIGDITNGRLTLWEYALELWKEHWIRGIGIRSLTLLDMATHNVYIELLAEVGILGVACFCAAMFIPFFKLLRFTIKNKRNDYVKFFSLSAQLFFLLYCFTGNPLFDHKMMWIYAVILGVGDYSEPRLRRAKKCIIS